MILNYKEKKIVCDGCNDDLTDYEPYKTAAQLRKENKITTINGFDYCAKCNPNKQ